MTSFGVVTVSTEHTIPPAEIARWAEGEGFESILFGEHTHIPTRTTLRRPHDWYKRFYDPFVCLSAAAAVTERIKIGTSVCLASQHPAILLAKTVATLDRVSAGRLVLGVGVGWNTHEMADLGVPYEHRWDVLREHVLAMRAIWEDDVAEFHGDWVRFDPMWCWPKPVQSPGPPVLIGAGPLRLPLEAVVEYGDGWMPMDYGETDLGAGVTRLRAAAVAAGRSIDELDLTVVTGAAASRLPDWSDSRVEELRELGFGRILFLVTPDSPDAQWPVFERYAKLMRASR